MRHRTSSSLYAHKPYCIEAAAAHRKKIITYRANGTALLHKDHSVIAIPLDHQFDLTQATIFGLNERLTSYATSPVTRKDGKTLRDEFNNEWSRYTKALEKAKGTILNYGVYAYYPERNHLVRYCSPYWHRVVSIASSSKLITDPAGIYSWKQIQDIFEHTTIAVAGGSVGNNIMHSAVMDLRPRHVKIADKSLYKMENINRVRLSYWDIVKPNNERLHNTDTLLRNKAEVTASQLYAIDPYLNVYVYSEGIHKGILDRFLGKSPGEPAPDILIEEVDDPEIKLLLREEAKKRKIPLIMASDLGSSVQLDILRYDKNPKLSLTYGMHDNVLRQSSKAVSDSPSNRGLFFQFVDNLIGTDWREGELKKILEGKTEIPTSTIIPQLGSTAAVAGGIVAEAIARLRLGHAYPPRVIINKHTFAVKIYTE